MKPITYDGINNLNTVDARMVRTLIDEFYPKLKALCHNDVHLQVHIRVHEKGGHQQRVDIRMHATTASKHKLETRFEDYDLAKSVHKSTSALLEQAQKAFKKPF